MNSMSAEWPWNALGLDGEADARAVKRAYAQRLKAIDRSDATQFQQLVAARDLALKLAGPAETEGVTAKARPSIRVLRGGRDMDEHDSGAPRADLEVRESETPDAPDTHEVIDLDPSEPAREPEPPVLQYQFSEADLNDVLQSQPLERYRLEDGQRSKDETPIPFPPRDRSEDRESAEFEIDNEDLMDRLSFDIQQAVERGDEEALGSLLGHPLMQDRQVRRAVENQLAFELADLAVSDTGLPRPLALVVDSEFGWVADPIGASHRLGRRPDDDFLFVDFPMAIRAKPATVEKADQFTFIRGFILAGFLSIPAVAFYRVWDTSNPGGMVGSFLIVAVAIFALVITSMLVIKVAAWAAKIAHIIGPASLWSLLSRRLPERWQAWGRAQNAEADEIAMCLAFLSFWVITLRSFIIG